MVESGMGVRASRLRTALVEGIVMLCLAGVVGAVAYRAHPMAPALYLNDEPLGEHEVDFAAIEERWGGDVLWIDARPGADYAREHVPGAIPLNEEEWDALLWQHADTLLGSDQPLVVYCGAFACQASHKVAERLRTSVGLPEVYVLRGGWKAIVAAGLLDRQ